MCPHFLAYYSGPQWRTMGKSRCIKRYSLCRWSFSETYPIPLAYKRPFHMSPFQFMKGMPSFSVPENVARFFLLLQLKQEKSNSTMSTVSLFFEEFSTIQNLVYFGFIASLFLWYVKNNIFSILLDQYWWLESEQWSLVFPTAYERKRNFSWFFKCISLTRTWSVTVCQTEIFPAEAFP